MDYDIQTWTKIAAYSGGALSIGIGAVGAAIGEGYTAGQANSALSRNPEMSGELFKTMLLGQAVAESAAIFALLTTLILLFTGNATSFVTPWALLAAGLCIGLGSIGSGIGAGIPAGEACKSMVRQPAMSNKLTTNMLIGSAVCQSPAVFALVVSLVLIYTDFSLKPFWPTWAAVLGAGLSMGFSSIGSGIGSGLVAQSSCEGVARQPNSATVTTNTMLLGQAITQTSAIYGLLIAFVLIFKSFPEADAIAPAMALLSSGICMGIGGIGAGIGEGITAKAAVAWIARTEEAVPTITRTMLVGMAVAESTAIYSMVIALVMIFVF